MRTLIAFGLLACLPGCATVSTAMNDVGLGGVTTDVKTMVSDSEIVKQLRPFGWEEERAIGEAVALQAISRFGGLYMDGKLHRYVGRVGQAVAQTSDRPGIPYHFGVLNDAKPNAFACPGGYVFVTVGLLKLVKDESELAGVLGHEIAHVSNKHALKVIRRAEVIGNIANVTQEYLADNPEVFDGLVDATTSAIFDKGFDQGMETAADADGVEFAYRVGYDPAGISRFLVRLAAEQPAAEKGGALSQIFATHPPAQRRVTKINKRISEQYSGGGAKLKRRYAVYTNRLRPKAAR